MKTLYETFRNAAERYRPRGPYKVSIWSEADLELLSLYEARNLPEAVQIFYDHAMPPRRGLFAAVTDRHKAIVLGYNVSTSGNEDEFHGTDRALDLLEACYPAGDDEMVIWRAAARGELKDLGWNVSS